MLVFVIIAAVRNAKFENALFENRVYAIGVADTYYSSARAVSGDLAYHYAVNGVRYEGRLGDFEIDV